MKDSLNGTYTKEILPIYTTTCKGSTCHGGIAIALDYSKMVGLLVEAIKEQQIQIENLKIEIEGLKKQNSL